MELKFAPIAKVVLDRHRDDTEEVMLKHDAEDHCIETAAQVYAIARRTTDALHGYIGTLERASARDSERFKRMKEAKDELDKKVVELDRRLRDPNRLRPDPLGPSVPRGSGKRELVSPEDRSWCEGAGKEYVADTRKLDGFEQVQCSACGRWLNHHWSMIVPRHYTP